MKPDETEAVLSPSINVLRIIVAALCMGVATFAVIVLFVIKSDAEPQLGMLTMLSGAFGAGAVVLSFLLPRLIARTSRQQIAAGTWQSGQPQTPDTDAGKLMAVYQTTTIIGAAILEGASFLALVAYMTERHPMSLAVAAILFVGLLLHFPTRTGIANWIDHQSRAIEDDRMFADK